MKDEEVKEILSIVEFCILMQNDEGIMGKAPSYIMEKFFSTQGDGVLLDGSNYAIFTAWREKWMKEVAYESNE